VEPSLRRNLPAGHVAFASLASERALVAQAGGDWKTVLGLSDDAVSITKRRSKPDSMASTICRFAWCGGPRSTDSSVI
jgi:hypothetical protein